MLEPFGLLNFIQSALKSSQTTPSAPPRNTTEQTESAAPSEPTPPPPSSEPPRQENPFLDFCKLHDERAKRIKKDKK